MSKAIILQHVPYEGPGRIVTVLRDYGIPMETRHLYRGDEVPTDLDELRLLVVMGGPMGVADIGKPEYPFLAAEVEVLKRLIAADRPVLGICLGAQLIAHAGGAKVYANPQPEIGWGPVSFPFPGGNEPIVTGLHDGAMMFHWHFDTFDLPKLPAPPSATPGAVANSNTGSVLMSSTKTCKNQALRLKNRLIGFQYHFELTQAGIDEMLSAGSETVRQVLGAQGIEQIRQATARYYREYARLGDRILHNIVQFLKLY